MNNIYHLTCEINKTGIINNTNSSSYIIINNIFNFTENISKAQIINSPIITGMKNFFIFVTVISSGFFVATLFVGKYIFDNSDKTTLSDDDLSDEQEDESEYVNKYLDEYANLKMNDLSHDYDGSFIEENTPRGLVKINYDNDLQLFNYYSDRKEISYKILETVSRLFVIRNNCKNIYINYQEEIDKVEKLNREKILKEEELEKKEVEIDKEKIDKTETKSVFANFKNYNKDNSISELKQDSKNDNNSIILPERCNTYKYRGKLIDYEDYVKNIENTKNIVNDDFEHLDYATFKMLSKNLHEKKTL